MSLIIAYKKDDVVYMGADTRLVMDDEKVNKVNASNYRIQKLDSGMLVGYSGDSLEEQTMSAYTDIFTLDKNGQLTKRHIVKEIVPKLYKLFQDTNLLETPKGEIPFVKLEIILAYQDMLYIIGPNFMVCRSEGLWTFGYMSQCAHGAFMSIQDTEDVNERIVKAMEISAKYSMHVGGPYVLIDTKDQQFKVVGGNRA